MLSGADDERLDPYGGPARRLLWLEQLRRDGLYMEEGANGRRPGPPLPRGNRSWTPLARALAAVGDQWTLLIVLALAAGSKRLSDLRAHVPGISTGVLNRHLQTMVEQGLLVRQRFRELPPRVEYRLAAKGEGLLPIATELARWGMTHMWSGPQGREHVDIGAILRLLPTLLEDIALPDGVIEMIVELEEGPEFHLFNITKGRIEAIEPGSVAPWTRIVGGMSDWIEALGPFDDPKQLQIAGEEQLALTLLRAMRREAADERDGAPRADEKTDER
jgi:DNA-binding HxlR family transcriptional regulator